MISDSQGETPTAIKNQFEQSVPARFRMIAAQNPDGLAVRDEHHSFTYAQLNRVSDSLAARILAARGHGAEAVAILVPHGAMQVAAMLGVLKTGKYYVPLDPGQPSQRLRAILDDAGVALLLSSDASESIAEDLSAGSLLILSLHDLDLDAPVALDAVDIAPHDLALLHYTSGSTGKPKGVRQTHRNINHFMVTIGRTWPLGPGDRVAHFVSNVFSAHVMTVFGALLNGAALFPFNMKERMAQIPDWLTRSGITVFFAVPSAFRTFCDLVPEGVCFPDLRMVGCAGETVFVSDLNLFKRIAQPGAVFRNLLASTEAYYLASMVFSHADEPPGPVVPVGYPVPDKEIRLVSEDGEEVPPGQSGEIVVRSIYLSPGYWNQPEAASLMPDPDEPDCMVFRTGDIGRFRPDGALIHIGRKDNQVKIRGQRVELGEIETHLLAQAGVKDAVVTAVPDAGGSPVLYAYITAKETPVPDLPGIREALRRSLPDYMVPASITVLESFPQTGTGKVDRSALPPPATTRPPIEQPYLAPRSEMEARLAQICEDVLGISPVGVKDNFYDLGLNSLNHLSMLLQIEQLIGHRLPAERLSASPTIEQIAEILSSNGEVASEQASSEEVDQTGAASIDEEGEDAPQNGRRFSEEMLEEAIIRAVVQRLPYPAAARLIARYCGLQRVQQKSMAGQAALAREFLQAVGRTDDRQAIQHSLANNFLLGWRLTSFRRMAAEDLARQTVVEGEDHLHAAARDNVGTLLINSHFVYGHLLLLHLARTYPGHIGTLGAGSRRLQMMGLDKHPRLTQLDLRGELNGTVVVNLYRASLALKNGSLVQIAADGYQGTNGLTYPWFGRQRSFRAGFAELALSAGAPVVPVFVTVELDGRLRVEFHPALDQNFEHLPHNQQVRQLVDQYVAILDKKWQSAAENVSLLHMQNFLALPKIEA